MAARVEPFILLGVHEETLNHIGKRFSQGPPNAPDFKIHRAMERILKVLFFLLIFYGIVDYFVLKKMFSPSFGTTDIQPFSIPHGGAYG